MPIYTIVVTREEQTVVKEEANSAEEAKRIAINRCSEGDYDERFDSLDVFVDIIGEKNE